MGLGVKKSPADARVLVASDDAADAAQILRQLGADFDHVRASTNAAAAVTDFESFNPDVLVLAFDALDKAQRYYLGLYRLGSTLQQHPHRTVILCNKSEVRAVFDLCKQEFFDDYVLYWPQSHDGPRLSMSIWMACRAMQAAQDAGPWRSHLVAHARQLDPLTTAVDEHLSAAPAALDSARRVLQKNEADLGDAVAQFSERLTRAADEGGLDIRDPAMLSRVVDSLKNQQMAQARTAAQRSLEPLSALTRGARERIAPALQTSRVFLDLTKSLRPVVLVVDDDELTRRQVQHVLEPRNYDLVFAEHGASAVQQLRRLRPDVIVMDIRLPDIDGLSLTQQLRSLPQLNATPVVMLSGDARRETLISSMQAGADAFVVKPFTSQALIAKLEAALSRPERALNDPVG